MKERLGKRGKKAHVVPNGVDLDLFQPMERNKARGSLGLDPGKKYVLFAADPKRQPQKRVDLARAALDQARGSDPSLELLVVADQPHEKMPLFLSASNCVLLTSDWEGSPNIVKEAMACDVPVVSVDAGDVRDLLAGISGCQICKRDPIEIAFAIGEAVRSTTQSRSAVTRLAAKKVAEEIQDIYRGSLGRTQ